MGKGFRVDLLYWLSLTGKSPTQGAEPSSSRRTLRTFLCRVADRLTRNTWSPAPFSQQFVGISVIERVGFCGPLYCVFGVYEIFFVVQIPCHRILFVWTNLSYKRPTLHQITRQTIDKQVYNTIDLFLQFKPSAIAFSASGQRRARPAKPEWIPPADPWLKNESILVLFP